MYKDNILILATVEEAHSKSHLHSVQSFLFTIRQQK